MNFLTLFQDEEGEIVFDIGKTNKKNSTWYDETTKLSAYWKEKTKLRICTNITELPHKIPKPVEEFNIPLLKSSLQKAVRRKKSQAAVNLAWQLISQDISEFLRRFPIIILEDSVLHPNFSNIIWMMIADSKGWKLRKNQIKLLLETVYQISSCEYREYLHYENEEFSNPVYETKNHLLASIILRINYGGMKGDQEFMKRIVMMWLKRFEMDEKTWRNSFELIFQKIPNEIQTEIESLIEKKCLLLDKHKLNEGIDFHVFPKLILDFIKIQSEKRKILSKEDVQSLVWYHRSGISFKKYITKKENLLEIELQDFYESDDKLDSFKRWKEIEKDWIDICSDKFWNCIEREEEDKSKSKKVKLSSHKITDFFKFK